MTILISLFVTIVLVAAGSFVAYLVGARMKERYSEDPQNVGYRSAARVERERKVPLGQTIEDMPRSAKLVIAGVVLLSAALVVVTNADARQGIADGWSWMWAGDNGTDPSVTVTIGDDTQSEPQVVTEGDLHLRTSRFYQVVPSGCRGMYVRDDGQPYGTVLTPGSHFSPLTPVRVVDCAARTVIGTVPVSTSDGFTVGVVYTATDMAVACDDLAVVRALRATSGFSVVSPGSFNSLFVIHDVRDGVARQLHGQSIDSLYERQEEIVAGLNASVMEPIAHTLRTGSPAFTFGEMRVERLVFPERGSNE